MARVIICDTHAAIRTALRKRIADAADLELGTVTGSAEELLHGLEQENADVLVLEIMLDQTIGLDLVRQIHRDHPDLRIVVYTIYDEAVYAERTIKAGASAYVMKKRGTESVLRAIRAVLTKEIYVSKQILSRLAHRAEGSEPRVQLHPTNVLTDLEMSVFQLLGHGRSVDLIAEQLGLPRQEVVELQEGMVAKMQLASIEVLVQYAGRVVHQ